MGSKHGNVSMCLSQPDASQPDVTEYKKGYMGIRLPVLGALGPASVWSSVCSVPIRAMSCRLS
jgi:hypothetical protein